MPLLLAFGFNLALIPLVRWVSFRLGRVAQPRQDRWHRKPTPTLGGVGIFTAFILTLLVGEVWMDGFQWQDWGFLSGAALLFFVGIYDEFRPMSPAAKLVAQIIAGTLVVLLGYTSTFFNPRIANVLVAQVPNILFTFVWLIGITNAINFLDNMDGLAGGIALITAGVLSYFFGRAGNSELLWVSLALVGSLLGFLVYNFPPARIFMGDSGSLFLGFILATLAIAQQKQQASNVLAVLGVPMLLFLLPILDTSLVTFTRLLRGQSPAQGGRDHTSHRLIAFGLSERQTLLVLYSVALASAVMAASLERLNYYLSLALAPLLIIILAVLTAYLGGLKVVSAPPPPSAQRQALARIMLSLTYRRRVLEVVLDFFVITLAYYLAFLARYGLVLNAERFMLFLRTLPVALAGSYLAFFVFGVYRGVWRYVGFNDLLRFLQSVLGSAALITAALTLLDRAHLFSTAAYSHLILAWFAIFLFLGLAASRSSFRLLDSLAVRQPHPDFENVLIYGAGDAGEMALRWIQMNPALHYRPQGFIDMDPLMVGRQIHGVEVLGGPSDLERILTRKRIVGLILAGLDETSSEAAGVLALCQQHGCWVRRLRLEFDRVDSTGEKLACLDAQGS